MKLARKIIMLFVLIHFVMSMRNENESETIRKQDMRNRSSLMKNKINQRKDIIGNSCNCEELKKEIEMLKELNKQLMSKNPNQIQGNNISATTNQNQVNGNMSNNQINGNMSNINQEAMNQNTNQMNNQSNNVNQNNATPKTNTNQNQSNNDSGELSTGTTQNTNQINQNQQQVTSSNNQMNNQQGNNNNNINPMNNQNTQQPNTNTQPQMNNSNQVQPPQNNSNNCNQPSTIYIPETSFDPSATTRIIESQRQAERQAKLKPLLKCFSPYNPYTTIITNTNSQCETCCIDTLQSNPKAVNCCIEKCIVDSNSQSKFSLFCINYKFLFNTVQLSIPEL